MSTRLLGNLTPQTFLKRHWQKRPLLVRNAFPNFKDPLSADELAGLAMEGNVPSRLIMEKGGKKPWEVTHGPFSKQRLETLPKSHWSLLVSRVNELVDDAALMLDPFDFIPGWRLDDLMVSFAPEHGTVGPHVDSYDVFLIQGQGRRRWQIDSRPDMTLRPNLDLKVLKRFNVEKEWILEPGDMLYLPPGVAHYGVALEPCMTYSVGFRAPSVQGLMLDLLGLDGASLAARFGDQLYADPDLKAVTNPGEIDRDALKRVAAIAKAALDDPELFGRWFGKAVTRPESSEDVVTDKSQPRDVSKALVSRDIWRLDDVRFAWLKSKDGMVHVFIGGDEETCGKELLPLVKTLAAKRHHAAGTLSKTLPKASKAKAEALALLGTLCARGVIAFR